MIRKILIVMLVAFIGLAAGALLAWAFVIDEPRETYEEYEQRVLQQYNHTTTL